MKAIATIALLLVLTAGASGVFAATPESVKLTHRGIAQSEAGNYRAAIATYTRAIKADAGNAQAWHERAMARMELDQDAQAIPDFEQALKIHPNFPGARPWLARALAVQGEHLRAAEQWLQHIRADPLGQSYMGVDPLDWTHCAEQFSLAGERQRAIELLEEYFATYATRLTYRASDETAPMRELAKLYDQAGQPEKAQEMRQRARASKHKVPADDL